MYVSKLHRIKPILGFMNWSTFTRPPLDHGMLGMPLTCYKNAGTCKTDRGGKHHVTYKPYVRPCDMDHDHKNMTLGRPMSPHLDVYGPTLPAMTSIAQRGTGAVLTVFAASLAAAPLMFYNGVDTYIAIIQSLDLSPPIIIGIKAVLGWPFAFHYFIGIRFCLWNAGLLLDVKTSYTTAYMAILASFGLAIFIAIFV